MTTILNLFSGGGCMFIYAIGMGFSCILRYAKDDKFLSLDIRNQIESKIEELAQKLGISKPIELIEKRDTKFGAISQGIAPFSGRAGIIIDSDFTKEMSEAELEFLIAHELSHIRANDNIWTGAIPGIVGVITTLAVTTLFASKSNAVAKFIGSSFIGLSASLVTFVFFSKWREECADKLAFSICSEAAQEAAPLFFEKIRVTHIELRNGESGSLISKLWKKFLITEDGDSRLGVLHPLLKTRTEYLQAALEAN